MKLLHFNQIRPFFLGISFPIFLLCQHCIVLAAEEARVWTAIGPEGGNITQLVVSSTHPDTVYSATDTAIFKSHNGGISWVLFPWHGMALNSNSIKQLNPFSPSNAWDDRTLAIDAKNPNSIYTALQGELLKTLDNGMNWLHLGIESGIDGSQFFLLNTKFDQNLITLDKLGLNILKSEDSGQSWLNLYAIENNPPNKVEASPLYPVGESTIKILSSDPQNPMVFYGYTEIGYRSQPYPTPVFLYKSMDSGINWMNITPSNYVLRKNKLFFDPNNSQTVYAIFDTRISLDSLSSKGQLQVQRSEDGGNTWSLLSVPAEKEESYAITDLVVDPVNTQILYASLVLFSDQNNFLDPSNVKRIAKSIDSGKNWKIIETAPYLSGKITVNPANNQILLMATGQGVMRSQNGGDDWMPSNSGLRHFGGIFSVASDNTMMYMTSEYGSYHFKSQDAGKHWEPVNLPVSDRCLQFFINPANSQDIVCGTTENFYQSLDAGENWKLMTSSYRKQMVRMKDGNTIFLAGEDGISKSQDNGVSWQLVSNLNSGRITIDPVDQKRLYFSQSTVSVIALYQSKDGGLSWEKMNIPAMKSFPELIIHPAYANQMILTDRTNYFFSQDKGVSWKPLSQSYPSQFYEVYQLVFHPIYPAGVIAVTNNGVFETRDLANSWQQLNTGLESLVQYGYSKVRLLVQGDVVYASSPEGIFKLTAKSDFTTVAECLFSWAEQNYPRVFTDSSSQTQQWGGYHYRYYQASSIYLGFFYEKEAHYLQPALLNRIENVGLVETYKKLANCQ